MLDANTVIKWNMIKAERLKSRKPIKRVDSEAGFPEFDYFCFFKWVEIERPFTIVSIYSNFSARLAYDLFSD